MELQPSTSSDDLLRDPPDFSLVLGGPLFQLLYRAHLSGNALEMAGKRIVVIALFSWLPLLVLSALQGRVLGGGVAVPFLFDVEIHTKFLVSLPLLIGAELVVHRRMRFIVKHFLNRGLIPENAVTRFNAAVAAAYRLRNSVIAEVLLIAVVYAVGVLVIWRQYLAFDTATWYAVPSAGGARLTLAGLWYGYVSLPIFQFLLLRWYFRLVVWARFLWQVSRIELSLIPTHPDRAGGLGFLSGTVDAFSMLAVAHGALFSGQIANRIFHLGATLPEFKMEAALLVTLLLCGAVGPLLVFATQLAQAWRTGLREYDTLAQRYVREFDAKWLRGGAPVGEPFVGSGDIQSLADLGNSFQVIRDIQPFPFGKDTVIQLVVITLLPMLPLVLTMIPLEELIMKLLGAVY